MKGLQQWLVCIAFAIVGVGIGFALFHKQCEEPVEYGDLGVQLELWRVKAHNLEIEKQEALFRAASHKQKADSLQDLITLSRSTPGTVNYLDSADFQIVKGFTTKFGPGVGRKIPIPRDQLGKALNSLDTLEQTRKEVKDLESVIYHLEGNHESLLEAIDKLEQKGTVKDSALSDCQAAANQLKADNKQLTGQVQTEQKKKNTWKLVSFVSITLNAIQAWLR